ncbi:MAG: degS [Firmicutes bacterium]|nr:degS [Bacillota bacterium]
MQTLNVKILDKIIKQTIAAVENGKTQIFEIYEAARTEMENVKRDLERVKQEAGNIILKVDETEKRERQARLRLSEVHRNFKLYTEEDMRLAYQEVESLRISLAVTREQEKNLRLQRDNLEIRLKNLKETLERAEGLVTQVGAALGFLGNHMEAVLNNIESFQQRQMLASRIIKAQEEERRRVAREIHDGPAQAMANVVFRAEVCERIMDNDVVKAKAELKSLQVQVRAVLKETRQIIFGLRPMTLDDLGLVPTIRRLLETLKERTNMFTELRVMGEEKRLEPHFEVGLFRIIQEALNNIEKHAKANSAIVRIDICRESVAVIVEDDGQGFDISGDKGGKESFGIMGIQERIELLEGSFEIKTAKGKGTKVYIKVPLNRPAVVGQ